MVDAVADALGQVPAAPAGGEGGVDGGVATPPAWMAGLADEGMRSDPELARYASIDDLAKGFKETRTWARGRVAIPGAEADDNAWQEFGARMRPEKAEDYDIPVPEGADKELSERYREFAYRIGMPARWVKANAEFHNQFSSDKMSSISQQGLDGMKAVELELGSVAYNQRLEAVKSMMATSFGDDMDAIKGLESSYGSERTLRFLFSIAEKTGELGKVNPTDVALSMGNMSPDSAQGEINRLMDDKDFMGKASTKGTPEYDRWKALNKAAAQGKK
jgi:hypothetical protein